MRGRIFKIILLFIFIMPVINAKAYNNQYFDIEMPSKYKIVLEKDGAYQWINNETDSNYVVSVRLKSNDKDIINYSSKNLEKFVEGVVTTLEDQYDARYTKDINVSLLYYGKEDVSNYKGLLIKVKIPNFLDSGNDMMQSIYIVESKNFLYSITYSAPSESFDKKNLDKVITSFEINDELVEPVAIKLLKEYGVVALSILGGLVVGILISKKQKRSRRYE